MPLHVLEDRRRRGDGISRVEPDARLDRADGERLVAGHVDRGVGLGERCEAAADARPAALGQDALDRRAPAAGRLQVEIHQLRSLAPEPLFQQPPEPLLVAVELEEAEERSGHDDVLDHFLLEIAQRDLAGRNREDAHSARLELLDGDRPRGAVVEQHAPVDEVPAVTEDGVPVGLLGHIRVDVVVESHQNVDGLVPPGEGRAIGDHQRVVLVGAVDR